MPRPGLLPRASPVARVRTLVHRSSGIRAAARLLAFPLPCRPIASHVHFRCLLEPRGSCLAHNSCGQSVVST
eukprot:1415951-Alexandrium_andersonii.AAC.1